MTRVVLLAASAALALSLAACDRVSAPAGKADSAEKAAVDSEAVKQAFAAFNAAIANKDLAAIRAHYASDAVMVLPNLPPFNGADAIMADYEAFASDAAGKYEPGAETTYVSSGGDLGYGQVNYQVTYTNPDTRAVQTANRYNLSVYKKQSDGSWKIVYDINTDIPKAN
ncbi:MAG: YybH family protein [Alphaproteobacteria bacterium]